MQLQDRPDPRVETTAGENASSAVQALAGLLSCQTEFIERISDEQYVDTAQGPRSTIGRHTRHVLDHIEALLSGLRSGMVDYDARKRGTNVERSRADAIYASEILVERLCRLDGATSVRTLRVSTILAADGARIATTSSFAREVVFVVNHTLHHQAMMAVHARAMGVLVATEFGFAPSTLACQRRVGCVRSAS